ncbi:UDP-glucose 4-epimerase [Knoellia flava TL1]|uniref:UDP-glucose 4-epimerase n=2 Tax=Knoellia flava TaxID=913969 RepID=A0A8H9KSW5_9MICO|nr:UDP-glucose 4-epimerase GalE [Knoellia flava]KGN34019.1 UDP-glucose 4-epimerase [Knoellia flava TL1]GGB83604.1 UDP-glucose 4-epimerase [Knoellia flava]
MHVLVSGGAGYIGSHTVVQLLAAGHEVTVVDSFANAKPSVVGRLETLTGKRLDVRSFDLTDRDKTEATFVDTQIDAVVHFAGLKAVGQSVAEPLSYYENNLDTTLSLLRAMDRHGVRKLVFSSSATVYGANPVVPMTEEAPTSATNPYGWTKVMNEQVLRDMAVADPTWRIALLRYFNPVGAHPSGTIGEDPSDVPNNLMPFLAQVAVGRREKLSIFGGDYPTPDGTGVRDYIHVDDLAAGHIAALHKLASTDTPLNTWNLGTGRGTSVLELLHAFERAVGRELPHEIVDRRPGDIAQSYADPRKAEAELGWKATRTIDDMCADTWRWQSANPDGYP